MSTAKKRKLYTLLNWENWEEKRTHYINSLWKQKWNRSITNFRFPNKQKFKYPRGNKDNPISMTEFSQVSPVSEI
jgi:hypothetical protein